MTPGSPRFWSLTSLLGAVIAVITAVAVTVVLTADESPGDDAHSEIIAASQAFFEVSATGDRVALAKVVCAETMAGYPGPQPTAAQREVVSVAEIVITGDTATGSMVVTEPARPELGSALVPMSYVNEDGWKLCASNIQE